MAISEETVIRNGVPIPKDSQLLNNIEIPRTLVRDDLLQKANLATLPLSTQAPNCLPVKIQFLVHSIPLLDNLSTQILRMVGIGPYEETLAIVTQEEPTPQSLVYHDLVELFEQIKKIYSEEDPFLTQAHILNRGDIGWENLVDEDNELEKKKLDEFWKSIQDPIDSALRKSNLATFLLATLGSIEVGFFYLNESFLDVFSPITTINGSQDTDLTSITNGKLLKSQAGLFLELKTQAYISALESGTRSRSEILQDIFPDDLDQYLLSRRGAVQTTPAESDFLYRCKQRREALLESPEDEDLAEKYEWLIFLKELFNYVSKNIGSLLWGRKNRGPALTRISVQESSLYLTKDELQKKLDLRLAKEREIAEASNSFSATATDAPQNKNQSQSQPQSQSQRTKGRTQKKSTGGAPPRIRHILRRPWSSEEEAALVEALKEFGTQWSKILEHYGAGGIKSEALKNRTQVQLKDKARNWKMALLKNSQPLPDYLQKVTGDVDLDERSKRKKRKTSSLPPSVSGQHVAEKSNQGDDDNDNNTETDISKVADHTESNIRGDKEDANDKDQIDIDPSVAGYENQA